jgi:enediyne biosynthesis protein E4
VGLAAGVALPDTGSPRAGMGIDAADIDNSGRPSLIVTNFAGEGISLFHNEGGGQFLESAGQWRVRQASMSLVGWSLVCFDYDLDGLEDLLVVNGHLYDNIALFHPDQTFLQKALLFHNKGGRFAETAGRAGPLDRPMAARGAAFADIDGDGDQDLLIVENTGRPHLLRNDGGNRNNWLRVRTIGSASNRDGIGAKVAAETGGTRQTRWVKGTAGFLSSSELTLTFGLGTAARVERVTVTWPSGQVDHYANVAANQTLLAREGHSEK